MRNNFTWIFLLIWPLVAVWSRPAEFQRSRSDGAFLESYPTHPAPHPAPPPGEPYPARPAAPPGEQVISVRITSSVAVGRTQLRPGHYQRRHKQPHTPRQPHSQEDVTDETNISETVLPFSRNENETPSRDMEPTTDATETPLVEPSTEMITTTSNDIPDLSGANIEFIKQLNARKEHGEFNKQETEQYFQPAADSYYPNDTEDSAAEASVKSISEVVDDENDKRFYNDEDVPLARSIPFSGSSGNQLSGYHRRRPFSERRSNPKLTTVSFNVVHNHSSRPNGNYDDYNKPIENTPPSASLPEQQTNTFAPELPKIYNEPAKIYSQPAKVYSEPAKFYSEPAKIYSEPAKIYSEPAKVYSEPAKVYSEPAKFYSQPASLHLPPGVSNVPWQNPSPRPSHNGGTPAPKTTTPITHDLKNNAEHQPERNYEVDETESVMTDGRSHGVQDDDGKEKCKQENCKVGYVVEGRQFKKYQVEEKTPDGFIVGEYGVVRNEDGALRGVRYTADSDVSPRLIYDTLMKFLQLK